MQTKWEIGKNVKLPFLFNLLSGSNVHPLPTLSFSEIDTWTGAGKTGSRFSGRKMEAFWSITRHNLFFFAPIKFRPSFCSHSKWRHFWWLWQFEASSGTCTSGPKLIDCFLVLFDRSTFYRRYGTKFHSFRRARGERRFCSNEHLFLAWTKTSFFKGLNGNPTSKFSRKFCLS